MKKGFISLLGLVAIVVIIVAVALMVGPCFSSHAASVKPHFSNGYPQLNLTYHGGPVTAGTTNIYAIFWEPAGNVSTNYNVLSNAFLGTSEAAPFTKSVTTTSAPTMTMLIVQLMHSLS